MVRYIIKKNGKTIHLIKIKALLCLIIRFLSYFYILLVYYPFKSKAANTTDYFAFVTVSALYSYQT